MRLTPRLAVAAPWLLSPSLAHAAPLTLGGVFQNATPIMQVLMVGLLVAAVAAIVLCGIKLTAGGKLVGGSQFISALRLGGPTVGLFGAAYNGAMMSLGIANQGDAPMHVLAPGFAEAATLAMLGFLAGVVAMVCHGLIEARIDRAVLKL